jgi:hypothetical protein
MRGIFLRSGDREDEIDTTGIVKGEEPLLPLGGIMDDGD